MWDQTYANMLSIMDTVVANVTNALIDTGQWNRTLLIFTADNGGISTVGWVRCGVSHHPPSVSNGTRRRCGGILSFLVLGCVCPRTAVVKRGSDLTSSERGYVAKVVGTVGSAARPETKHRVTGLAALRLADVGWLPNNNNNNNDDDDDDDDDASTTTTAATTTTTTSMATRRRRRRR